MQPVTAAAAATDAALWREQAVHCNEVGAWYLWGDAAHCYQICRLQEKYLIIIFSK